MKKTLALLTIASLALVSCVTTVTTNTLPDGTTVTVTSKTSDPVAIANAVNAAKAIAPVIQDLMKKEPAVISTK